jgi:hypothetical protein
MISMIERIAIAIGRLDQALNRHPLRPAWEHHRSCLEPVDIRHLLSRLWRERLG